MMAVSKNRGTPKMDGLWWKTLLKWMIWRYHYFWKHPHSPWFSMGNGVKRIPPKNPLIRVFTESTSRMFKPQGVFLLFFEGHGFRGTTGSPGWPKKRTKRNNQTSPWSQLVAPHSVFGCFFFRWKISKRPEAFQKKSHGAKKRGVEQDWRND